MRKALCILSVFSFFSVSAQHLIPYQVQDLKSWDEKKLWGYKNEQFDIVIPPLNEYPSLFVNGYAILKKNGKCGLINSKGMIVVAPKYAGLSTVQGDYTTATDDEGNNFVLSVKDGSEYGRSTGLFQPVLTLSGVPGIFKEYHFGILSPTLYGLKDAGNKMILPPIYPSIDPVNDETFCVRDSNGLCGLFRAKEGWVIKPKYDSIGKFSSGFARVCIHNKYGFINYRGWEAIPVKYDAAEGFTDGIDALINDDLSYAAVKLNNEAYFIDDSGKELFKGKGLKEAIAENNHWFIVRASTDSVYIIDKDFKVLAPAVNKVITADGKNFMLLSGTKAYGGNTKALQEMPVPEVMNIAVLSNSDYVITTKTGNIVTDSNLKAIIPNAPFYFYVPEELRILAGYFSAKNGSSVIYSFFDRTGKEYSDITK